MWRNFEPKWPWQKRGCKARLHATDFGLEEPEMGKFFDMFGQAMPRLLQKFASSGACKELETAFQTLPWTRSRK
eukprot:12929296-Prorocentrum_lima.AAC.1